MIGIIRSAETIGILFLVVGAGECVAYALTEEAMTPGEFWGLWFFGYAVYRYIRVRSNCPTKEAFWIAIRMEITEKARKGLIIIGLVLIACLLLCAASVVFNGYVASIISALAVLGPLWIVIMLHSAVVCWQRRCVERHLASLDLDTDLQRAVGEMSAVSPTMD
jgi:hypothetical protein